MCVCSFLYLCLNVCVSDLLIVWIYNFLASGKKRKRQTSQTAGLKPLWLHIDLSYLSWLSDSDIALGVRGQRTFPPCSLHPISVASDFFSFKLIFFSHFHSSSFFVHPNSLTFVFLFSPGSFWDLSLHNFRCLRTSVPSALYPILVPSFS